MTPPSTAPADVPEPKFITLLRRLGMGTLTFDVPRMGQQGYVPVSEFLKDLDDWTEALIEAHVESALADQDKVDNATAAAPSARPTLTDLVGPPPGTRTAAELDAQSGVVTIEVGPLPGTRTVFSTDAAATEGTMIAFWSQAQQRFVADFLEPLTPSDLHERLQDYDVIVAFGDVPSHDLIDLAQWAETLIEETTVGLSGLIAPDDSFIDGIDGVLDYMVERTGDPRSAFPLPPQSAIDAVEESIAGTIDEPDPDAVPGVELDSPVRVAFWSNVEDRIVVRYVDSLDVELAEWCEDEDAPLWTVDRLVAFGDVTDERLAQLAHWAHMQLEEDLVAYAGPPTVTTPGIRQHMNRPLTAIDGIEGVIASQVARTGDPRENFLPPADPTVHGAVAIPREGIFGDMASVMAELGMPEEMIEMLLAEEKQGMDLHAQMTGQPITGDANPYPERPDYTPIEGGSGTTEPFAVIMTDPGDWPYNNAYISTDAAVLHRIEHDQSMPSDEVLQEVTAEMETVADQSSDSEGKWWASVTKALDEAGIPEDRRFEGIEY